MKKQVPPTCLGRQRVTPNRRLDETARSVAERFEETIHRLTFDMVCREMVHNRAQPKASRGPYFNRAL